jgi:hypothetical protein
VADFGDHRPLAGGGYALLPPFAGVAALAVLFVHMSRDPKVLLVAEPTATAAGHRLHAA